MVRKRSRGSQTSLDKFGFAKVRLRQCAGSVVYITLPLCLHSCLSFIAARFFRTSFNSWCDVCSRAQTKKPTNTHSCGPATWFVEGEVATHPRFRHVRSILCCAGVTGPHTAAHIKERNWSFSLYSALNRLAAKAFAVLNQSQLIDEEIVLSTPSFIPQQWADR